MLLLLLLLLLPLLLVAWPLRGASGPSVQHTSPHTYNSGPQAPMQCKARAMKAAVGIL